MNRGLGEGEGPWGTLTVIYEEEIRDGKNRHMDRSMDYRSKVMILRVSEEKEVGRSLPAVFFTDILGIQQSKLGWY